VSRQLRCLRSRPSSSAFGQPARYGRMREGRGNSASLSASRPARRVPLAAGALLRAAPPPSGQRWRWCWTLGLLGYVAGRPRWSQPPPRGALAVAAAVAVPELRDEGVEDEATLPVALLPSPPPSSPARGAGAQERATALHFGGAGAAEGLALLLRARSLLGQRESARWSAPLVFACFEQENGLGKTLCARRSVIEAEAVQRVSSVSVFAGWLLGPWAIHFRKNITSNTQ